MTKHFHIFLGLHEKGTRKVWFEDKKGERCTQIVRFDGTPFVTLGRKVLECQHPCDEGRMPSQGNKVIAGILNMPHICPFHIISVN